MMETLTVTASCGHSQSAGGGTKRSRALAAERAESQPCWACRTGIVAPAPVATAPVLQRATGAWCRSCGGPVADGSGRCECC